MSHAARSRPTDAGARGGRLRRVAQAGALLSVAAVLAACGGQASTSSSSTPSSSTLSPAASSTAATSAAATSEASSVASSEPGSSAAGSPSAPAGSSSAGSSAATGSAGTGATSIVPAPTGDALDTVLAAKCAAFGTSLEDPRYGLSDVKQIEDTRGVCRWEATGLSQPAVLQVDPRVAGSAQTDQQDRELFCADISEAGAADPQSNRAKRIAEQVRSQLYYYPAGDGGGLATLSTFREGSAGLDGGISLGCDQTYAYETRIYTTAPLTANLSGTSLSAAHRAG